MVLDPEHFLFRMRGLICTLDGVPLKHVALIDFDKGAVVRYKTYTLDGKEQYEFSSTGSKIEIATEELKGQPRLSWDTSLVPTDFPAYVIRTFPELVPFLDIQYA